MPKEKYDFAGWVTKNDTRCSDGVVIKHGAFKDNDQKTVPLVWNHNHSEPTNVLGHVMLHNDEKGVYGYGYFNETDEAKHAKELIKHGDISAMSIGANRIKKQGQNVIHGMIYEVSLVLRGANPGALIETVMAHSDDSVETDKAIIYTGNLIHSADDILEQQEEEVQHMAEKTIGDILDTLNEEQMSAVEALIANVIEDDISQNDDEGGEDDMKHNVFNGPVQEEGVLTHSDIQAVFDDAKKMGSLKEAMLEHSITNIEYLFPDAQVVSGAPFIYKDQRTSTELIMNAIHKSPFSRVKTIIADLTAETARARGYIKGNEKLEQVFSLLTRSTDPQTIYKKQKLDRDDIVDITDFDVVGFVGKEMKMMLLEEVARAVLVGDGRNIASPDKIKADKIRPIISDNDLYTIKKDVKTVGGKVTIDVIPAIIKALAEFEGSGTPTMYCHPALVADLRLLTAVDGRFLFGDIPTKEAIAARLGVSSIVETTFMANKTALFVNLNDYTLGSTKGGEVTNFEDFDIDFNQYKYLIETRLSGALTIPKSAIYLTVTSA
mgnify:FL=1